MHKKLIGVLVMENFEAIEVKSSIDADEKNISIKLSCLRRKAGISCDEFAEALGIEEEELEAYENGSEHVPASVIALVCALSGVPFEYFFGDEVIEPAFQSIRIPEEHALSIN